MELALVAARVDESPFSTSEGIAWARVLYHCSSVSSLPSDSLIADRPCTSRCTGKFQKGAESRYAFLLRSHVRIGNSSLP